MRRRALQCLSPVHAKISWPQGIEGDWQIGWTRRTRLDGDDFDVPDIPLGEAREAYALALLLDKNGQQEIIAEWVETQPHARLSQKFRTTHKVAFGGARTWRLRIAQLNDRNEAGAPLYLDLTDADKN